MTNYYGSNPKVSSRSKVALTEIRRDSPFSDSIALPSDRNSKNIQLQQSIFEAPKKAGLPWQAT